MAAGSCVPSGRIACSAHSCFQNAFPTAGGEAQHLCTRALVATLSSLYRDQLAHVEAIVAL